MNYFYATFFCPFRSLNLLIFCIKRAEWTFSLSLCMSNRKERKSYRFAMTRGWVDGDRNVTFSRTICFSSSWLSFMINWFQQSFIVAYGWIYTLTVIGSDVTQQYQDVRCSHMRVRLAAEHRSRTALISDLLTAAVRPSGEHLAWINHR